MFKTFAAALLAASVIASPVLAQGTTQGTASKPASTEMTKAPDSNGAVKTHKGKSHKAMNHSKHRKHVKAASHAKAGKHVKVARHGRHHVKHVAAKPAPAKPASAVTTTGSAPKAN
jgi:hypothetical protein